MILIQFNDYCRISAFPQDWSAIISKKSPLPPNFFWRISIALTTIYVFPTGDYLRKNTPLVGTVLNWNKCENDFSNSLIIHKEKNRWYKCSTSLWKSREKLSLLHPNFLLRKSFCSCTEHKEKNSTFQTVYCMKKRICKHQTIHIGENIHIVRRQSWWKSEC